MTTTTIDIPDDVLKKTLENTKAPSAQEAVLLAVEDYNRRKAMEEFIALMGTSDTFMTVDELMDRRHERGKYGKAG